MARKPKWVSITYIRATFCYWGQFCWWKRSDVFSLFLEHSRLCIITNKYIKKYMGFQDENCKQTEKFHFPKVATKKLLSNLEKVTFTGRYSTFLRPVSWIIKPLSPVKEVYIYIRSLICGVFLLPVAHTLYTVQVFQNLTITREGYLLKTTW